MSDDLIAVVAKQSAELVKLKAENKRMSRALQVVDDILNFEGVFEALRKVREAMEERDDD